MKKLILILLLVSHSAFAGISLDLKGVGVVELVESVVRGTLQRDYVISPDVLATPAKLSMSVKNLEQKQVLTVLSEVLKGAGLALNDKGGILYLEKIAPAVELAPAAQPSPVQPNPLAQMSPFGQYGQMFGQQNQLSYYQNGQVPKAVAFHKPRGKSMEFLATVAKLAGAFCPENKGKGDVLVYAGDEETVARAKKLLEEVDVEAQTVQIRAALLEFTEGDSSSKSLSLAFSALGGKLGFNYDAGSPVGNALTFRGVNIQAALGLIDAYSNQAGQ